MHISKVRWERVMSEGVHATSAETCFTLSILLELKTTQPQEVASHMKKRCKLTFPGWKDLQSRCLLSTTDAKCLTSDNKVDSLDFCQDLNYPVSVTFYSSNLSLDKCWITRIWAGPPDFQSWWSWCPLFRKLISSPACPLSLSFSQKFLKSYHFAQKPLLATSRQ